MLSCDFKVEISKEFVQYEVTFDSATLKHIVFKHNWEQEAYNKLQSKR